MIAVKGNQPTLLRSIKATIADRVAIDSRESCKKTKGRTEHRDVRIWGDCSLLPEGWSGIKSIVHCRSYGERSGKLYDEDHYYISSLEKSTAEKFAGYIRSHWQAENNLHRVIDVVFQEDTTKQPSNDIYKKFAILRRIGINIYRINGFKGLKHTVASFINRIPELFELIKIRT